MYKIHQTAPNFKILDCTIRDGGLVNDSNFDDETVRAAYLACSEANIDIMEIGFKDSDKIFSRQKFGKWRFCDESDVMEIIGSCGKKISISELADAGKCDWRDFPEKEKSQADIIRCAFYEHQTEDALDIVNSCADKGYQTALCMMAASTLGERAIDYALDKFARSQANIIYLMDSFGALMPEQVETLSDKYCQAAHSAGKLFGIHCHNNLQCAFANTIAAISRGADIADCTLAGLGKGAGNCPTEMLVKYVGQKYKLRPILKAVENFIEPMRKHFRWGFDYPYMISGLLNIHPREAMEFEKSLSLGERESIVDFYDKNFKKES